MSNDERVESLLRAQDEKIKELQAEREVTKTAVLEFLGWWGTNVPKLVSYVPEATFHTIGWEEPSAQLNALRFAIGTSDSAPVPAKETDSFLVELAKRAEAAADVVENNVAVMQAPEFVSTPEQWVELQEECIMFWSYAGRLQTKLDFLRIGMDTYNDFADQGSEE